jgi:hypothetical protein
MEREDSSKRNIQQISSYPAENPCFNCDFFTCTFINIQHEEATWK